MCDGPPSLEPLLIHAIGSGKVHRGCGADHTLVRERIKPICAGFVQCGMRMRRVGVGSNPRTRVLR